ncbi:ENTH/ANTH/VHS superfamily protein isoform X2 [Wolffia australiana]
MSGVVSQPSLRKYLGAIKDSTTVGLAKVNSDYKELDIAVVKATNHVERPPKEKYIRAIFAAVSASRPRADVAYCIHALARRLAKTRNWAVALKTLIVIHRAMREVDPTFREELINYGRSRNQMLNMAHFKDDSSAHAWDYSAWIRTYALYLEERLECFRVLKYDVETDPPRNRDLDTVELLEQLPVLQQLLYRLLGCLPQGAAAQNFIIQLAMSMISGESIKIHQSIDSGTLNLVDKFFEMQRPYALKALEVYRRAVQQGDRLAEFYEACKAVDIRRGVGFPKIEQPTPSFLTAMEEYVKDAPRTQQIDYKPKVLAIEYIKKPEAPEPPKVPSPPPEQATEPEKEQVQVPGPVPQQPDLLGLSDPTPEASNLDMKNAMALAIVPVEHSTATASSSSTIEAGTTGWELALVSAPSSQESAAATSKLAGGLDKLTLDSLYDDAIQRANQPTSYNPWEPMPGPAPGTMMHPGMPHDPFYASSAISAPTNVQMAAMAHQQQAFMMQQQMMMMGNQPHPSMANPFGNPQVAPQYNALPHQYPNGYRGFI